MAIIHGPHNRGECAVRNARRLVAKMDDGRVIGVVITLDEDQGGQDASGTDQADGSVMGDGGG